MNVASSSGGVAGIMGSGAGCYQIEPDGEQATTIDKEGGSLEDTHTLQNSLKGGKMGRGDQRDPRNRAIGPEPSIGTHDYQKTFMDEHVQEIELYQNKIRFEKKELERLEREKEELKKSSGRVYTGRDEMSHLNYLRKKALDLEKQRREMQAYIDKRKVEKREQQNKKESHQELIHKIKQQQSIQDASKKHSRVGGTDQLLL